MKILEFLFNNAVSNGSFSITVSLALPREHNPGLWFAAQLQHSAMIILRRVYLILEETLQCAET